MVVSIYGERSIRGVNRKHTSERGEDTYSTERAAKKNKAISEDSSKRI